MTKRKQKPAKKKPSKDDYSRAVAMLAGMLIGILMQPKPKG